MFHPHSFFSFSLPVKNINVLLDFSYVQKTVNFKNRFSYNALHYACLYLSRADGDGVSFLNIIERLLELGADPIEENEEGHNSLFLLIASTSADNSFNLGIQGNRSYDVIKNGDSVIEAVKMLINHVEKTKGINEKIAFINKADKNMVTPLHISCLRYNKELIVTLLENGAKDSVNSQDRNLDTPLHFICYLINAILEYLAIQKIQEIQIFLGLELVE